MTEYFLLSTPILSYQFQEGIQIFTPLIAGEVYAASLVSHNPDHLDQIMLRERGVTYNTACYT